MFDIQSQEVMWGGRKLTLETGRIARQADGAVIATYGETVVLCAVTAAKSVKEGQDFFPLTVHYQELLCRRQHRAQRAPRKLAMAHFAAARRAEATDLAHRIGREVVVQQEALI